MLNIENLHVKLEEEDKQILKGVNLSLEPGKVHAIMGPNGSGKSTLVRCISRLIEVTGGEILIEGENILEASKRRLIDLRRSPISCRCPRRRRCSPSGTPAG